MTQVQQLNLIPPAAASGERTQRAEVAAALRGGLTLNASQIGFALRARAGVIRPEAQCTVKFEGRELLTATGGELLRMIAQEREYGLVPGGHVRLGDRCGTVLTLTPADVSEVLYGRAVQPQEAVFVEDGKAAMFGGEIVRREALTVDHAGLIERLEQALLRCEGWGDSECESQRRCHVGLSQKMERARAGDMTSYDMMAAEWDWQTSQPGFWNMLARVARIVSPQEAAAVDEKFPASSVASQGIMPTPRSVIKETDDGSTFEQVMVDCYSTMVRNMPDNGMQIICFAHTDPRAWMRFGLVLSEAGLAISKVHMIVMDPASVRRGDALTEAAVIVCRKRVAALPVLTQQEFAAAVERAVECRRADNKRAGLRPAGKDLRQQGVVAAMQTAVNNTIAGTDRRVEMEATAKGAPYNAMAEMGGKLMLGSGA
ncbi:hypothetical protein [Deinococcus marmoris]|uniref:Uncharacterized protein n=1 Tax=Deinococcus marmoris TaxID=249408 RepID=A0A1U7P309_9DEIO|nr:hypothetical protein [Deinococcus marmoris]OLV19565.1 hypothetical protein BOO71_0002434 [Deinococcus marmoris]